MRLLSLRSHFLQCCGYADLRWLCRATPCLCMSLMMSIEAHCILTSWRTCKIRPSDMCPEDLHRLLRRLSASWVKHTSFCTDSHQQAVIYSLYA